MKRKWTRHDEEEEREEEGEEKGEEEGEDEEEEEGRRWSSVLRAAPFRMWEKSW